MQEDLICQVNSIPTNTRDYKPSNQEPTFFDWQNRWLKGHEYAFILNNIDAYCAKYGFQKYDYKTHPVSIYSNPMNGIIYFVKAKGIGTDLGFPRLAKKKRYRWKKMNFTTDLPKQMPYVTYVVASALKSHQFQDEEKMANFRMHAVVLHKDRLSQYKSVQEYVLCHVRKVGKKKTEDEETEQNDLGVEKIVDFYKLFAYLHNFSYRTITNDNFSR